mmetsp:Transcript_29861/g.55958  ORF Transcript_29861/g.55958 Transcript_29861/m.55958 type:complete len:195 (-) Transcript_29861:50-634(-)
MLSRLQKKYAEKPVRFLLFPCNQFAGQEPGTNAEIKKFAEQYVTLGKDSNVIMFAKSSLNNVTCSYSGEDACTPESKECCAQNDVVYDYLLANTAPGTIQWNFDKIVTDTSGRPFPHETIMHGGDVDAAVSSVVESLLQAPKAVLVEEPSSFSSSLVTAAGLPVLGAVVLAAAWRARPTQRETAEEGSAYIQIA